MNNPISTQTLQEMKTYYRERAPEYDEWFYRQGRYNHGPEANACWFAEVDEVFLPSTPLVSQVMCSNLLAAQASGLSALCVQLLWSLPSMPRSR
jgi:hypothetical protein